MTPFLSRPLMDEIAVITPEDDRKPLARASAMRATTMVTERELERRVMAELMRVGPIDGGQLAARLLLKEPDVVRALLKLALAQKIVKLRGGDYAGGRWKACPFSSEESV